MLVPLQQVNYGENMKKRTLTLLEVMIVIFLITLITGAIGYSMRGTLDKGRAFRTQQGMDQLHDLLMICLASEDKADAESIAKKPAEYLKKSGLAKNPDQLILDGWKSPYQIVATKDKSDFKIRSESLEKYNKKKGVNLDLTQDENEES